MQPFEGGRDHSHRAMDPCGLMLLALPLEQARAQDQGEELHGVDRERARDRVLFGLLVLEAAAHECEVRPLLRSRSVELDHSLVRFARRREVAVRESALARRELPADFLGGG